MFFHQLKNFSPYSGHLYDAMKVPFINKKEGFFGRDHKRFNLMDREGYLPFRELIMGDRAYFISDTDLYDFLAINERTINNYDSDGCYGWNLELKENFTKQFTSGYHRGLTEFEQNLGITYTTLPHEQLLPYLRTFCLHCLDFLFFDGDLADDLLYNLGYLQASLYRGFIEINTLRGLSSDKGAAIRLHFDSYFKSRELAKKNDHIKEEKQRAPKELKRPTVVEPQKAQPDIILPERIEILCDVEEVKKLWQALTAPIKTKNGMEPPLFSAEELDTFLGTVFSSGAFPEVFKQSGPLVPILTPRGEIRQVLNALMYNTYNLNRDHNRSANQSKYVSFLNRYFTGFARSGTDSITRVMAAESRKGIDVLKKSTTVNPYIEEILSILKKHKLLH
jgi:hypothetical protein